MKVLYVMPVHKNGAQVLRLVRRLQTDEARFVVHVDAKAPDSVAQTVAAGARSLDGVHLLERQPCYWGGFGIVDVALRAIDHGLRDGFDYACFVTGQDYPIRSAEAIEDFLAQADGASFLNHWRLPTPYWGSDGGLARVERWHLVSRLVLHLRLPWRRRVPHGLAPYGGEAHWCLSRAAAEHLAAVARDDPRLLRFFRHVLHPDEIFVQTVLAASPLAPTLVDDHLRYIDWSVSPGPKILTAADYDAVVGSGKLFARKLDAAVDERLMDMLDDAA